MKILITGGHLTPALSLIDLVQRDYPADQIIFVGREFSQDITQQKAVERYEIEKRGLKFIPVEAVRLGPTFLRRFFFNLQRLIGSYSQARQLLLKQRPKVVLSFGGYVAVPIALAAKRLGIPVVTHEQTMTSGFANKLISFLADKIAVTFPNSVSRLFAAKTVLTGNPLRAGVFKVRQPKPNWLPAKLTKPLIVVMGGNQGSATLNALVAQILPEILKDWAIVHQCGQPTALQNSHELLERAKQRLPLELHDSYWVKEWLDETDLFWLYQHAVGAISRAGANATQELAAAKVPAILVPLPQSRHGEQQQNANWLAKTGGAIVINQTELTPVTLLEALSRLRSFAPEMKERLATLTVPADAAAKLYQVVVQTAQQA